jgi:hypothetical protein
MHANANMIPVDTAPGIRGRRVGERSERGIQVLSI